MPCFISAVKNISKLLHKVCFKRMFHFRRLKPLPKCFTRFASKACFNSVVNKYHKNTSYGLLQKPVVLFQLSKTFYQNHHKVCFNGQFYFSCQKILQNASQGLLQSHIYLSYQKILQKCFTRFASKPCFISVVNNITKTASQVCCNPLQKCFDRFALKACFIVLFVKGMLHKVWVLSVVPQCYIFKGKNKCYHCFHLG